MWDNKRQQQYILPFSIVQQQLLSLFTLLMKNCTASSLAMEMVSFSPKKFLLQKLLVAIMFCFWSLTKRWFALELLNLNLGWKRV